jgi:hypothetical protein
MRIVITDLLGERTPNEFASQIALAAIWRAQQMKLTLTAAAKEGTDHRKSLAYSLDCSGCRVL